MLVIEDDEALRFVVARALGSTYTIVEAATGAEALARAEAGGIDLVVQDLRLPDNDPALTGMRLLLRVRAALNATVAIVVISGADLSEAREAGFVTLGKPFDPKALRALVDGILASDELPNHVAVIPAVTPTPVRPWWMAAMGVCVFVAALLAHWLASAPIAVTVAGISLGILLIWSGPALPDIIAIVARLLRKKD